MSVKRARDHLLGVFVVFHLVFVGVAPFRETPPEAWGGLGGVWNQVRQTVRQKGRWYADHLGVRQSWLMFANVHTRQHRLEIYVEEPVSGELMPIYMDRSRGHTWNAVQFDHYRMREFSTLLFAVKRHHRTWKAFTSHVGAEVLRDFPWTDRVVFQVRLSVLPEPQVMKEKRRLHWTEVVREAEVARLRAQP